MRIPQIIISIVIAVVSSLVSGSIVYGGLIKQVENNNTRITKLEEFLVKSTDFQSRTDERLISIKEKIDEFRAFDRRGSNQTH